MDEPIFEETKKKMTVGTIFEILEGCGAIEKEIKGQETPGFLLNRIDVMEMLEQKGHLIRSEPFQVFEGMTDQEIIEATTPLGQGEQIVD